MSRRDWGQPPVMGRLLELQAPQVVPDGAGGQQRDWVTLGTLWAHVRAGPGRELGARAGGEVTRALQSFRVVVRSAPVGDPARPAPDQRFREGTRVFVIIAVAEDDPGGRYLTCHVREEVAA